MPIPFPPTLHYSLLEKEKKRPIENSVDDFLHFKICEYTFRGRMVIMDIWENLLESVYILWQPVINCNCILRKWITYTLIQAFINSRVLVSKFEFYNMCTYWLRITKLTNIYNATNNTSKYEFPMILFKPIIALLTNYDIILRTFFLVLKNFGLFLCFICKNSPQTARQPELAFKKFKCVNIACATSLSIILLILMEQLLTLYFLFWPYRVNLIR